MKAAIYNRYGAPDVVDITEVARPEPGPAQVLVRVTAAGVTTADWRLRAAAFPGLVMGLAGRLMFGLFRPRNKVLGSDYAGIVEAVGAEVRGFAVGDRVFGFARSGAHAEYLVAEEDGPIVRTPDALDDAGAAALPFGGLAALEFLDRFAKVRAGERVLIVGASGGVGAYAVQIARALGAEVTAVASAGREDLVLSLGAGAFVDYRASDPASLSGPFDVVLDTIGRLSYAEVAPMLARGGRFVPLNFGLADLRAAGRAKRAGHRVILQVNGDSKAGLARLTELVAQGQIRPVIDRVYPFGAIREAHAHVEGRSRKGAVILQIRPSLASARAA